MHINILLEEFRQGTINGRKYKYAERVFNSLKTCSSYSDTDITPNDEEFNNIIDEFYFYDSPGNRKIIHSGDGICQLCGKNENVYQYRIFNRVTHKYLWTGSICILKFQINIYDNNKNLITDQEEKKKIFNKNKQELKETERKDLIINKLQFFQNDIKLYNQRRIKERSSEPPIENFMIYDNNYETGAFWINHIARIFTTWEKLYGSMMPYDVVKLFKIDYLENKYSKNKEKADERMVELLKGIPARAWIVYSPILPKKYYNSKYGFTNTIMKYCKRHLDDEKNYNDFSKDFNYKAGLK